MKHNSRINNAIKNVGIAGTLQVLTLLLSFVSRTFFVKLLGNDYLSCDGLFTNILTILSFSELGIGSAIIFSLYKPIAEDDYIQIGKLMHMFRTSYRYIALFISIVGLSIIPFLSYLVKDVPDVKENISVIYCLFLANTVASYIFGYKRSFLIANQENYIVLLIQQVFNVIKTILQVAFLYFTRNYIVYLLITIICTLLTNIISTIITDKKYPFIKKYKNERLTSEERKPIFSNISSILQYKLGSVILNGTDNIIISLFLKTSYVGICSNYNMIINAVSVIVNQAANGLQATIGNFNVTSNKEERYRIFKQLYFITFWLFGFFSISLANLLTPFITDVWLGKNYSLKYEVVIALSLSFFVNAINIIPSMFRTSLGYFKEAKMCPIIASILNIVLSIILAKIMGLSGVFFATAISRFFTFNIIDPYYVFKRGFGMNAWVYFKRFFVYFGILIANYYLTYLCVNCIKISGLFGFLLKLLVNVIVCNLIFIIIFFKTDLFKETILLIKKKILRRKRT